MLRWYRDSDWWFSAFIALCLVAALGVLVCVILWACGVFGVDHSHDNQHCVQSHEETWLMPLTSGKVTTFMPMTDTVCDKWVPNATVTPSAK